MQVKEYNNKIYDFTLKTVKDKSLNIQIQVTGATSSGIHGQKHVFNLLARWSYYLDSNVNLKLIGTPMIHTEGNEWKHYSSHDTVVEAFKDFQDGILELLHYFNDDLKEVDKESWYNTVYNP